MKTGGIDIGSRYIKYVIAEDNLPVAFYKEETGTGPLEVCKRLLDSDQPDRILATGYGRHLLEVHGNVQTITEIKAVARGAKEMYPGCRTIVDIGGQDTKVISLNEQGAVLNFEMNDRCAAGTGKFIEIMARSLGFELQDFGYHCSTDDAGLTINSMCTVFAESEVISLIAKGAEREAIASAIHRSIMNRVISLMKRIDIKDDIIFAGGCAQNPWLKGLLEERLQRPAYIYEKPDMLSAIGAALYAGQMN
ncbi:MAG TPA: acyl-CoA dehydratase activase [Thermodesulfovibrionales bacterium]|nr:acyl-CoA dehydratase activase [Thermodesulfovibrionales bacterium]